VRFIGNLLWFIFGGFILALIWMIAGLLLYISILGIPFGVQCMKIAGFVMWPFGREVITRGFGMMGAIGNVIWILVCGIELCCMHLILWIVFCVTLIGIPFGLQHLKMAKLALMPFGAEIHRI